MVTRTGVGEQVCSRVLDVLEFIQDLERVYFTSSTVRSPS